jgi:hypothetical protein
VLFHWKHLYHQLSRVSVGWAIRGLDLFYAYYAYWSEQSSILLSKKKTIQRWVVVSDSAIQDGESVCWQ